jgi:hypothetical protein
MSIVAGFIQKSSPILGGIQETSFCPSCGMVSYFNPVNSRKWFTLLFIPLFPIGKLHISQQCQRCGNEK